MIFLLLYNLGIRLYWLALWLASPFVAKARDFVQGRRRGLQHLATAMQAAGGRPVLWMHAASVGEFEQGRPLLEVYRQKHPNHFILLTFFSPSGYNLRRNYAGADCVCYLPLDTARNARRFLELVQPALVVFVKYDFWYHYLRHTHLRGIPLLLISATFRRSQPFFRRRHVMHGLFRQMLFFFHHIFTQTEADSLLLESVGHQQHSVAGDTRCDRVAAIKQQFAPIALAEAFAKHRKVMVVGSSWPQDHAVLLPLMRDTSVRLAYMVAPHEIHEEELLALERELGNGVLRYSQATPEAAAQARVLIIDNVGMLSRLYHYGHLAYIGGAFGKGLHNTLEAAVYGLPLVFGNVKYKKFNEAVALVSECAARPVANEKELSHYVQGLLADPAAYQQAAQAASRYVEEQQGATASIMAYIATHFTPKNSA